MDDDRFTELMGFFGTHLSRATYALEAIASAHMAMAEVEMKRYASQFSCYASYSEVTLRPAQCQEPCCQRET